MQDRFMGLIYIYIYTCFVCFRDPLCKHLQAYRFIGDIGRHLSMCLLMCVCPHVCCQGTSDLQARCTPRLRAGGLSTLGGRADLIFHMSTVLPWTPSLSPHGLPENFSVNTWLKYVILPAPFPTCCSLTCWASQLKANHSYRCWQLSLTHEMPLQSSLSANLPVSIHAVKW